MGKLSHIEDIERAREQAAAQEQAVSQAAEPVAPQPPVEPSGQEGPDATAGERAMTQSRADEEFHGISTSGSMGGMHKALIVIAVIVFIAAILYIVNSWLHFV